MKTTVDLKYFVDSCRLSQFNSRSLKMLKCFISSSVTFSFILYFIVDSIQAPLFYCLKLVLKTTYKLSTLIGSGDDEQNITCCSLIIVEYLLFFY